MDIDLSNGFNFDGMPQDAPKQYESMVVGDYFMRFTGFERKTAKSGNPMAVFRLDVVKGPTGGNLLHFLTLTSRAMGFIRSTISAARRPHDDLSNVLVFDDDWMKKHFLGRIVKVTTKSDTYNGKTSIKVDKIQPAPKSFLDDNPDQSPEGYWNATAFQKQSSDSSPSTASKAKAVFDDDIPF